MRNFSIVCLTLVFGTTLVAHGEWTVSSAATEFSENKTVEHRHLVVNSDTGGEATLDLALISANAATLHVIDNASGDDNLVGAMKREDCVAGVNGGYFDPAFAPIGLRIIEGAISRPLVRAHLLTGVLTASRERGVEIVRLGEFSSKRKLDAAMECGPFLVDLGMRVRTLNDTRSARRTFAAVTRDHKAALGYCDDATLAQLGDILSSKLIDGFSVWRAMNLDGGSSSAFWFKRSSGSALSIGEYKSVRDFIGLAPK